MEKKEERGPPAAKIKLAVNDSAPGSLGIKFKVVYLEENFVTRRT